MKLKITCLIAVTMLFLGCATENQTVTQANQPATVVVPGTAGQPALVLDPFEAETEALPRMGETLPVPVRTSNIPREYTGIIKNRTAYDVTIPSRNSGGTLTIPAKGFIEFIAWQKNFDLTVYQNGKPFYCLQITAHPREYAYMCKKYDFIAEIIKPEPVKKYEGKKKKRRVRKPAAVG
jgi:hypothetical protein